MGKPDPKYRAMEEQNMLKKMPVFGRGWSLFSGGR